MGTLVSPMRGATVAMPAASRCRARIALAVLFAMLSIAEIVLVEGEKRSGSIRTVLFMEKHNPCGYVEFPFVDSCLRHVSLSIHPVLPRFFEVWRLSRTRQTVRL